MLPDKPDKLQQHHSTKNLMLWQPMQARHASPVGLYFGITLPAGDFADVGGEMAFGKDPQTVLCGLAKRDANIGSALQNLVRE